MVKTTVTEEMSEAKLHNIKGWASAISKGAVPTIHLAIAPLGKNSAKKEEMFKHLEDIELQKQAGAIKTAAFNARLMEAAKKPEKDKRAKEEEAKKAREAKEARVAKAAKEQGETKARLQSKRSRHGDLAATFTPADSLSTTTPNPELKPINPEPTPKSLAANMEVDEDASAGTLPLDFSGEEPKGQSNPVCDTSPSKKSKPSPTKSDPATGLGKGRGSGRGKGNGEGKGAMKGLDFENLDLEGKGKGSKPRTLINLTTNK
jgi:hypothetical protein